MYRNAWTPAAPRRNRVNHRRDYGSAHSVNTGFITEVRSTPSVQSPTLNQSQPVLSYDTDLTVSSNGNNIPIQPTQTSAPKNRKKNFLSQSRERLDNFVNKISRPGDDYRTVQQRRKREGTLSPRSTEYSLILKVSFILKKTQEAF